MKLFIFCHDIHGQVINASKQGEDMSLITDNYQNLINRYTRPSSSCGQKLYYEEAMDIFRRIFSLAKESLTSIRTDESKMVDTIMKRERLTKADQAELNNLPSKLFLKYEKTLQENQSVLEAAIHQFEQGRKDAPQDSYHNSARDRFDSMILRLRKMLYLNNALRSRFGQGDILRRIKDEKGVPRTTTEYENLIKRLDQEIERNEKYMFNNELEKYTRE